MAIFRLLIYMGTYYGTYLLRTSALDRDSTLMTRLCLFIYFRTLYPPPRFPPWEGRAI